MTPHTMQPQTTILIVDDDKNTRMLLQKSFEKAGFLVVTAVNGRAGLEQALTHLPDIILSDVVMPEMNGYELCREVKNHPTTGDIPVILLTARDDTDSTLEGFLAGADEYIAKPFEIKEVLARVQRVGRWVQKKRASETALSGSLDKTPVFELLRFCEEHRLSGTVRITRAAEAEAPRVGTIHLERGEIMAIELGDHADMTEALDALLEWTEGTFLISQQGLQLPVEPSAADAAGTPAPSEPAGPEPERASPPPSKSAAAAHLMPPLRRILEELQADSDGLDHAVLADEAGQVISAVNDPAAPGSAEKLGALLPELLRFGRKLDEQLGLGDIQEILILSASGMFLASPARNLGVLGVAVDQKNQGMIRWNCKETLEKIDRLLAGQ